jgi:hypothetical protein
MTLIIVLLIILYMFMGLMIFETTFLLMLKDMKSMKNWFAQLSFIDAIIFVWILWPIFQYRSRRRFLLMRKLNK